MIDINTFHPFPRYGVAAAAVRFEDLETDFTNEDELFRLARKALEDCLTGFLLEARPVTGSAEKRHFHALPAERLDPGSKSGQIAANGFFIAPHVLTSNNAADAVKEIKKLIEQIDSGKVNSSYELKRSFAPLISKINGGKASMSNPRVDLLHAAFSAVAMASPLKAAAYDYDLGNAGIIPDLPFQVKGKQDKKKSNAGIIPDLPFQVGDEDNQPLIEFIDLFEKIKTRSPGEDASIGIYSETEKRYKRPPVFYGNYPKAPRTTGLGSVSLLAAIGKWAAEHKKLYPELFDQAERVLSLLAERPIYIISYGGTRQEQYGHHLVGMAMSGKLHEQILALNYVSLLGVEDGKKFSDPRWSHLKRTFDHFLRFFNPSAWRDFLAIRAFYPMEFRHLFKTYFMEKIGLPEDWVKSAMAYGRSLNFAAYKAAQKEFEDDKKAGRQGRTLNEYKNRILVQFESTIRSAKTNSALLSQMGIIVGRLTLQEISSEADLFMQKVAEGAIDRDTAKELMTAFMRLSPYRPRVNEEEAPEQEEENTSLESAES